MLLLLLLLDGVVVVAMLFTLLLLEVVVVVVAVEPSADEQPPIPLAVDWLLVVVEAKSNVVESTANSVGEPTKSNVIDEALEAGPEPFELAVEVTEVANI